MYGDRAVAADAEQLSHALICMRLAGTDKTEEKCVVQQGAGLFLTRQFLLGGGAATKSGYTRISGGFPAKNGYFAKISLQTEEHITLAGPMIGQNHTPYPLLAETRRIRRFVVTLIGLYPFLAAPHSSPVFSRRLAFGHDVFPFAGLLLYSSGLLTDVAHRVVSPDHGKQRGGMKMASAYCT